MEPPAKKLSLTYSLADQTFARTKSIGILNVSVGLLRALARRSECERLTVLSNHSLRESLAPPDGATIEHHDFASDRGVGRIWWDQFGVYSAARRTGNEWLFLPKGFASFSRTCPVRLAAFVHDAMHDHYDRHYPDAVSRFETAYFRAAFRATVRQAELIFTPSEFTLNEIKRLADQNGWRVPRVVCCGEGFDRTTSPSTESRRDILVLTSQFPHKLTTLAAKFLQRWSRENPFGEDVHWIGSLPKNLELPAQANWQRHSILPEAKFRAMMARARVVLSFSDYEGFGRPPVEAALAGACPVYSSIPTTREVMGDCGYSFDNTSYESFAAALHQALKIDPAQISVWSEKLAARHDWNVVADRVVNALVAATEISPS
jgi:glycosyltransferase involved in cell wall biosynthesis